MAENRIYACAKLPPLLSFSNAPSVYTCAIFWCALSSLSAKTLCDESMPTDSQSTPRCRLLRNVMHRTTTCGVGSKRSTASSLGLEGFRQQFVQRLHLVESPLGSIHRCEAVARVASSAVLHAQSFRSNAQGFHKVLLRLLFSRSVDVCLCDLVHQGSTAEPILLRLGQGLEAQEQLLGGWCSSNRMAVHASGRSVGDTAIK
eukprot:m.334072 g.334072  ORF g.334072 m.334072 type:complete len:202 (-) comp27748_c0_seq1:48-653(-)